MKVKSTIDYSLTLNDTSLIKGIAICFMLWHHLFYKNPEFGSFVYALSHIGKICVSLFLFLSAYGLTIQFNKFSEISVLSSLKFQILRFIKFYANYWVVFIIVVPLGVFFFGRTLEEAYSTDKVLIPFIRDFFGINYLKSYNITWWFNTLIICFYLIFPILFHVVKRWKMLVLIALFLVHMMPVHIGYPIMDDIKTYILIFSLGVMYALNNKIISKYLRKINFYILVPILILVFVFFSYLRQSHVMPGFYGMKVDPFLTITMVLISISC